MWTALPQLNENDCQEISGNLAADFYENILQFLARNKLLFGYKDTH
jgi:hypothetical protein